MARAYRASSSTIMGGCLAGHRARGEAAVWAQREHPATTPGDPAGTGQRDPTGDLASQLAQAGRHAIGLD